jgi:hypothetical protein
MFDEIDQSEEEVKFSVRASYLEIYNEQVTLSLCTRGAAHELHQVTDLLNPEGGILNIRWRQSGFFVEVFTVHVVFPLCFSLCLFLSASLSVFIPVCLSVCLPVCLSASLSFISDSLSLSISLCFSLCFSQ